MSESQQEKVRGGRNYKLWTMEESNVLLELLVDAVNRGWKDASGSVGKQTIEQKILPVLNERVGCVKTYTHYLSRIKWFKARYNTFVQLLGHSSGFGWDPIRKQFVASEEVWSDYFKNCVGAIDGTHIPATVMGGDISAYRNRHGINSQNVLAACNFDLEFIYVLSGWEGSAHDSKLLNDAISRRNGLKVPQGKYYLVDCGFANRCQFLSPFRGVRYHLKDFSGEGRHPENKEELFNLRHASLRNVVERIFGIFKSRFTIFKSAPPFIFNTQAELVLACAGLHNYLRKECRSDEFPMSDEEDEESNDELSEDEDDDEQFQSQEQQREVANELRLKHANDMWTDATLNIAQQ